MVRESKPVPDYSFAGNNLANVWLNVNGSGDYSVAFLVPSSTYHPFAYDSFDPAQSLDIYNYAHNNYYSYTLFNNQWGWQSSGYLGLGTGGLELGRGCD